MSANAPTAPLSISAEAARRFLVTRHGLAPPRALPPSPDSVLKVIERLGILQFDPLEVPGARNHDLVLQARIRGYRREWCEDLLYDKNRRLFELYNKSLNIVPIDELPHYRYGWTRHVDRYEAGILREQAAVVENILERIREEGPLSTADFAEHAHSVDWWWAPTRVARAVLEALFVTGRVGIYRREGNRRFYDLIERLVPAELLARAEPEEVAQRHRLLSRFRAVGLTSPSANAEVIVGTGDATERRRLTDELVAADKLMPVEIEGMKGTRYVVASDRAMLTAAVSSAGIRDPGVSFIAPLDPLVWDRRLLRDLWGFDYVWEVYVPESKRRWGYYVLPIVFGDRFVGRFEPRLDRATRTRRILGIFWESGFAPRREDGFVAGMRDALGDYMEFVGATKLEWTPATGSARRLFGTQPRHRRRN